MARRRQWLQAAQVWLVEHEPSIKGSLRLAVVVSRERWAHRLAGAPVNTSASTVAIAAPLAFLASI